MTIFVIFWKICNNDFCRNHMILNLIVILNSVAIKIFENYFMSTYLKGIQSECLGLKRWT